MSRTETYIFASFGERERERLTVQSRLLDPGTERHLERLGVAPGWVCAEVGAGAGSVARWLSRRVGREGRVLATDIDIAFLEDLRLENVEVRRHDIVAGPLPGGAYDLVHTRLLLMHLPARETALRHMIASLRPGGWLLVEDYDLATAALFHPPSALQERMADAVLAVFEASGADPRYGIKLLPALRSAGLKDVEAEARLQVVPLGTTDALALALKLEHFKDRLVATRLVSEAEVERAIEDARTPQLTVCYPPLLVTAWGRRPA